MIRIIERLAIPESEIAFSFTTSRGPGGQNVNKVATRAILRFDVAHSPSLSDELRARVLKKLASRINKHGILQIAADRERSQESNRSAAVAIFSRLLAEAMRQPRKRTKTKPTRTSILKRRAEKAARSLRKSSRRRPLGDE